MATQTVQPALRALINRVAASLDDLPATERAVVDEAVAVVRRNRTVMLGTPRLAAPSPLTSLPAAPVTTIRSKPA